MEPKKNHRTVGDAVVIVVGFGIGFARHDTAAVVTLQQPIESRHEPTARRVAFH